MLDKDAWKEKFLLQIDKNHRIENTILTSNNDYMILGLPFYNEKIRKLGFDKAINKWIKEI